MKQWRLTFILGVLALSYVVLGWHVYDLQINNGNYYLAQAEARANNNIAPLSKRGRIYINDKTGVRIPIAVNQNFPVAFTVPKEIKDPPKAAAAISKILNVDPKETAKVLAKGKDPYEPLLENQKISKDQAQAIKALALPGIYTEDKPFRFYPFGRLAAHVIGFVGPSNQDNSEEGRYGIELIKNDWLKDGGDIDLTIDRNVQAQAERILKNLVDRYRAAGGTVVVEEPKTGKIIALGNYPDFDPNNYSQADIGTYLNPALQSVYEPGSVFKPITMSIGLDTGAITPDTTYYDSGKLELNGYTIRNWDLKAHGKTTMTEVIEHSINTGAAFAVRKIGREPFYNYLIKFGLDRKTGLELPGETHGNLSNLVDNPRDINFATASFGQGVAVTPMELISAFASIANDGVLMKPYIIETTGPEAVRRVISREAANKVTAMMVSAVRKARVAQIADYTIAGKTGTAQLPDFNRGGYSKDFIHTFVGFAPASDPRFVILIKIDKPQGVVLSGRTVVPAFRNLAEFLINYYSIPPDNLKVPD